MPINSPRIQGKCLIASMSPGDEHGGTLATVRDPGRRQGPGACRPAPSGRRPHQLLEHVMKKSILLLLVLGAAVLTGCVHPIDLDTIAPAAKSAPAAN